MNTPVTVQVAPGKPQSIVEDAVRLTISDINHPHTKFFTVEIPRSRLMNAIHATKALKDTPVTLAGALVT